MDSPVGAPSAGGQATFPHLQVTGTFFPCPSPGVLSVTPPPAPSAPDQGRCLVSNPSLPSRLRGQAGVAMARLVSPTGLPAAFLRPASPSALTVRPACFQYCINVSPTEQCFNGADLFSVRETCGPLSDAVRASCPPPRPSGHLLGLPPLNSGEGQFS